MNDFIVLGGGTAGCISALMLKKAYPQKNIKIIESKKIGIIGVGEGSTEHWKTFCNYVDINQWDLIRETGATFKLGIYFKDWSEEDYIHNVGCPHANTVGQYQIGYASLISNKVPKKFLNSSLLWENKFKARITNSSETPTNQYHFDTFKLNKYLHNICWQRGIEVIDDEIVDAKICHQTGNILNITSETAKEYSSDFFIDCSGMKRFLICKKLGIKWNSYSDYLILNSAITFATEEMEEYNSWTLAQARSAGWSWHIPVQGRTGNGYVFSDNFISEEEAQKEIEDEFGNIKIGKKIKFDPGKVEKFWHKNCMAVGLSGNFLEPLEATSIGSTIQQMYCFINYLPSNDEKSFNNKMNNIFDNIVDYIQAHYLVKREDTPFWKEIKYNLKIRDSLKNNLEVWKNRLPQRSDFSASWAMFDASNYICVLYGLDWFDVDNIIKEYNFYPHLHCSTDNDIANSRWEEESSIQLGHKEYINLILRSKS